MDDFEKKLFVQLDDDSAAVREKALDALVKRLKAAKQSFRDLLLVIEQGAEAQQKYAALDVQYQEAVQHNAQWEQRDQAMQQDIARLQHENAALRRRVAVQKSLAWLRFNRMKLGLGAALLACAIAAYEKYAVEPWPAAADAALRSLARGASWGEYFDKPFVATVAGKPMWVLLRGEIDASSYADTTGRKVVMRCVHVFAVPAEQDSGEYRSADPYLFAIWMRWPERLVNCQPSPDQKEAKQ
jgi:hypothetical protein